MPKLYTKTGDKGYTSLYSGERVRKSSIFFQIVGEIDELSANIGKLIALISYTTHNFHASSRNYSPKMSSQYLGEMIDLLRKTQVKLLNIGSNIVTLNDKKNVPKITDDDVKYMEKYIDLCELYNSKLKDFILPGQHTLDSQCHITRAVTRRLERVLWQLNDSEEILTCKNGKEIKLVNIQVDPLILKYVNRLSDFFFALSRNLSDDIIAKYYS